MKLDIDEYKIGDSVDVFARNVDNFHDFSGIIIGIDYDTQSISVRDQDDDVFDVEVDQIRLTYSEEKEDIY